MTINNSFKSRPERLKYSKCMNFSLSGLDLKLLFMVSGAYYKSGLYTVPAEIKKPNYPYMRMILRDRRATLRFGGGERGQR